MQVAQDASIVKEREAQRPHVPVGLLSRQEKDHLIERGVVGLYRWYTERAQATVTGIQTDHSTGGACGQTTRQKCWRL